MAIGAMRALRRRGRGAGRRSVVGFDDVALAAYVDPPLTTIAQRTDEMGRWAVERLVERTPTSGRRRRRLDRSIWRCGASIAGPARRAG